MLGATQAARAVGSACDPRPLHRFGPKPRASGRSFLLRVGPDSAGELSPSFYGFRGETEPAPAARHPPGSPGVGQTQRSSSVGTSQQPAPREATQGTSFPWLRNYYPVAVEADLQLDKPEQVWLFGLDLVVWKGSQGLSCFQNSCPHRMAPLSEGVVRNGNLECSYHGWQFSGEGQCVRIPQAEPGPRAETACRSPRACARTFPIKRAAGLVWVWPDVSPEGLAASAGAEPMVPPDVAAAVVGGEVEPGKGPRLLNTSGGWIARDLPYGVDTLLENVMDPAHVLFSHHGLIGRRENAIHFGMKLKGDISLDGGVTLSCGSHSSSLRNVQDRVLEFVPPCFTKNVMTLGGGLVTAVCGYSVPTRPGHSRCFSTAWTKDMGPLARGVMSSIPAPLLHAYTNAVFDGDMILVALQEQRLAEAGGDWARGFYMPTPSDAGVLAFRRWWDMAGGSAGLPWLRGRATAPASAAAPSPGPVPASPQVLLDRLNQHTRICARCRTALRRLELAETGGTLAALALALLAAGGVHSGLTAGAAGAAALVALASSRLKRELIFKPYVHH